MFRGILVVYSVDLRALYENVAVQFERAEDGGGVGSEVRVSGTSDGDDHPPLFQMLHRAALDEEFAHSVDFEGAHDTNFLAVAFDRVTERDTVDDGGEHSHVVALRTVEPLGGHRRTAEDVASTDDDDDLFPTVRKRNDLFSQGMEEFDVDSVPCRALEGFAGKLEEKTFRVLNLHG